MTACPGLPVASVMLEVVKVMLQHLVASRIVRMSPVSELTTRRPDGEH
jgi:hypothetical protein